MTFNWWRSGVAVGTVALGVLAGSLVIANRSGPADAAGTAASCMTPQPRRVDLATPTFSNPTAITNSLFPRADSGQTIELGSEAGDRLRFEVTYLPEIKVVKWNGQSIETRVTHFVAYRAGRILETAVDFYAQDDVGNVWYFGEDVFNYENGVVVDHEGTWLAGRDGPPGMIMPAEPKVGDVYRPENIPGLVFEEVTVRGVGRNVAGPRGRVRGAISIEECLMDGVREQKQFAPGYGEFFARVKSADEVYGVGLAVPIDAEPGPLPAELRVLVSEAKTVFDSAGSGDRKRTAAAVSAINAAWARYERGKVPPRLEKQMEHALDALRDAQRRNRVPALRQSAIDVGQASLDLHLRHRSPADVDRDRLAFWNDQLALDRAAGDAGAVAGDLATITAIEQRS